MEEAILRLKLAADAGADVCFIEGVRNQELLQQTIQALAPKPVRIYLTFSAHHNSHRSQSLPGARQRHFRWAYTIIYHIRS